MQMRERRRYSRSVIGLELATVPAALNVRVLDISVAGVLLESSRSVKPGEHGRLSLNLGGSPFKVDVEVRRVATVPGPARYRIGAMFVGVRPELYQMIERFVTSE